MKVLVTGVSSGLGRGLVEAHLERGDEVWGVSRREPPAELTEAGLRWQPLDLADFGGVEGALAGLLDGERRLDLVHLNAGVLGEIRDMAESEIPEMQRTFDVNVWANKVVLDVLAKLEVELGQVLAVSSGASVSGSRGWNGYSISKAALNMLIKLYAAERPGTHFCSLAPGLIDTAMQDHLCGLPDDPRFGSLDRIKAARGTEGMPGPRGAADKILALLPSIRRLESGSFADVRKLAVGPEGAGPLARLDEVLPPEIRGIVARQTPIPSLAGRAKAIAAEKPELVRADIGQISGFDEELEVLYGPPVGLPELRAAVAEGWNLSHGLEPGKGGLEAKNVCITTGAAEGLSLLFRCFAQGGVVAVPRGHWSNYRNGAELAGGRIVVVDFFDENGALDVEGLRKAVQEEGASVLVANFPCNPTGAVLDRAEAEALAGLVKELDIVCIADEVYDRLRYDGHPPLSLLPFAPEHVVSVSSASKEYLLPGARVGYVLSANPDLTDKVLRKVVRASTASPNVLGQRRLLEFLGPDLEDLRAGKEPRLQARVRDEMKLRRDRLLGVLEKFGMGTMGRPGHKPEGTIFFMATLPDWFDGDDTAFTDAALDAACVSTVPGSAFGLPGSVRFSYGGMTVDRIEQLEKNLAALKG